MKVCAILNDPRVLSILQSQKQKEFEELWRRAEELAAERQRVKEEKDAFVRMAFKLET